MRQARPNACGTKPGGARAAQRSTNGSPGAGRGAEAPAMRPGGDPVEAGGPHGAHAAVAHVAKPKHDGSFALKPLNFPRIN